MSETLTSKQKRAALRSEVLREMHASGTSYDEAFQTVITLKPELADGQAPELRHSSERRATIANETFDGAAAADRRDKVQKLIQKYAHEMGLDPARDYDRIFNRVAQLNPELFSSMATPYRSPEIKSSSNPAGPHTPPSKYRPYRPDGDADFSTLASNPRVR